MSQELREIFLSLLVAVVLYSAFVLGADTLNPLEFHSESAPLEVLQDLLLLGGMGFSLWLAFTPDARRKPWAKVWLLLLAVLFLVILGNEIKWGRRLLSWRVMNTDVLPHGWTHNVNLHPLSPVQVDRPRAATMLIIALGAIGYPIIKNLRGDKWLGLPTWFAPLLGGIPWAALMIFTVLTNRFLAHGPSIFGLTRFQFGQIEELFIYLFMLNYVLARRDALRESVRQLGTPPPPS